MRFDPSEQQWVGDPADEAEFQRWFLEEMDAGRLESVVEGLLALPKRYGWKAARVFMELEQRQPLRPDQTAAEQQARPMSRLLELLAHRYTTTLAWILDMVGIYLRERVRPPGPALSHDPGGELREERRLDVPGPDLDVAGAAALRAGRVGPRPALLLAGARRPAAGPGLATALRKSRVGASPRRSRACNTSSHSGAIDRPTGSTPWSTATGRWRSATRSRMTASEPSSFCNVGTVYESMNNPGRAVLYQLRLDLPGHHSFPPSSRQHRLRDLRESGRRHPRAEGRGSLFDKALSFGFPTDHPAAETWRRPCWTTAAARKHWPVWVKCSPGLAGLQFGERLRCLRLLGSACEKLGRSEEAAAHREKCIDALVDDTTLTTRPGERIQ